MANRLNAPNQFETLSPPWILSQLDSNANQNQAAWNDSSLGFVNGICTDTGASNAYVVTSGNLPYGAPSAYNPGMTIFLVPANPNTGASTLQVGLLGTAAILTPAGNALAGGEIVQNRMLGLVYNSSAPVGFRIIGLCPVSSAFGTVGTSQSVECAGCTSVVVTITFSTTGLQLTLNHLATGVPVTIFVGNSTGGSIVFAIQATNPAGTAFTQSLAVAAGGVGSTVNMESGSISLGSGQARILSGQAQGTTLVFT